MADLEALANRLVEVSAALDAYIADHAERIAAPRIAEAEAEAAAQVAGVRADYACRLQRATDLEAELRRQLDTQFRLVARLRWVARYLPPRLRHLVLIDPPTPKGWRDGRPEDSFIASANRAAADDGVSAYPQTSYGESVTS